MRGGGKLWGRERDSGRWRKSPTSDGPTAILPVFGLDSGELLKGLSKDPADFAFSFGNCYGKRMSGRGPEVKEAGEPQSWPGLDGMFPRETFKGLEVDPTWV